MKNLLLLFLSSFLSLAIFAQELQFVKIDSERFNLNNCFEDDVSKLYLGISPVSNSNYKTHIRFTYVGKIIDFFSYDNKIYEGVLTNYIVQESIEKTIEDGRRVQHSKDTQYCFQQVCLDSELATEFVNKLLKDQQHLLEPDSVNAARPYFCCSCKHLKIDYKIDSFQNIHTIFYRFYKDTFYNKTVNENYHLLKSMFNLDSLGSIFFSLLPRGFGYRLGIMSFSFGKPPTKRQERKWARSRKKYQKEKYQSHFKYMKTVKDTIENYVKNELNAYLKEQEKYYTGNYYKLIFSKKGTVKRVKGKLRTNYVFWFCPSYWFEERYEFWKEKQLIKKGAKKIKIDFIDSKRAFSIRIRNSGNTIYID